MASVKQFQVTFDCAEPVRVARFWAETLGYRAEYDDEQAAAALDPTGAGPRLYFQRVPEGKVVKNRMHVCLRPSDRSRDEEIDRLLGLGAGLANDRRNPDGTGWAILTDPEGNEFCVLRSENELSGN
jgi:predicted enzyme related to lactoylglutathione lyase